MASSPSSTIESVIHSATRAEWTKEPIALVTLFRGVETVQVPQSAVNTLIGQGWNIGFDPTIVAAELEGALQAAAVHATAFAAGVQQDGYIDTRDQSDSHKTQIALKRAIELWNALQAGVSAAYPVREEATP